VSPLSLDDTITIGPDVVFKEVGGEGVILDLASGMYFGLDATATRLWTLLESGSSLRHAIDAMLDEFDVEPDRLERDLIDFVNELAGSGLATIISAPSTP
jgi:hypothetical protein